MLVLDKFGFSGFRGKRGLSNLIAYVLLITISLSLSIMVYGWLKFYVGGVELVECPNNVNVIIDSYECVSGVGGSLTVTIRNKGLFDVDVYILRVHDRVDAEFGIYVFNETGSFLSPGDKVTTTYSFPSPVDGLLAVTLADVQPFVNIDGKIASCESFSSQKINCN
jgi:hypothetical protein